MPKIRYTAVKARNWFDGLKFLNSSIEFLKTNIKNKNTHKLRRRACPSNVPVVMFCVKPPK